MTNNIVNLIMQMMTNGQNPNQVVEQIISKNPQAQVLFNQMKQSGMSIKDFTLQFAKQNNIRNVIKLFVCMFLLSFITFKDVATWGWAGAVLVFFKMMWIFTKFQLA